MDNLNNSFTKSKTRSLEIKFEEILTIFCSAVFKIFKKIYLLSFFKL